MTTSHPFTPEIALALAMEHLKQEPQFSLPSGAKLDGIIYTASSTIVFDLRKELGDVALFAMAFRSEVERVKSDLTDALTESALAAPVESLGFQFAVNTCDEKGEPAIDLSSNTFTPAIGVSLRARLFARTP